MAVCKVYLCCLSLPSQLFLPAEGLGGPAQGGLLKFILLLQPLQSHGNNKHRHRTMAASQQCRCAVSEAAVLQTPAKLKICYFHLTREESSRIRRELEQQTLLFLATGHSHFWENKRIEQRCCFSVVCSYILRDSFTWVV